MFFKSQKLPAMLLCLEEPPRRFLLCPHFIFDLHFVVISFLIFILLSMFFIHISRLLFHVTGTSPWFLRPVKVSTSSELYPNYFHF